jgi:hypothetical protein
MTGFMNFDIGGKRLHGFVYDDEDDTLDSVVSFDIYTTNNIRERTSPTESDDWAGKKIYFSIQEDGTKDKGLPILPTNFPQGAFQVTAVIEKNNADFGDYFIATDANQNLPGLKRVDDLQGWYPIRDEDGNQVYTKSYGYGFHAGGYSGEDPLKKNNPNDTTLGCGRMGTEDNIFLAELMQEVLDDGGEVAGCAH